MEFKDILELIEGIITGGELHQGEVKEPFSPWFIKVNIQDLREFEPPEPLGFFKVLSVRIIQMS